MEMAATEALYGFGAWLTTRKEPVTFSEVHDSGKMVELIEEWRIANDLPQVGEQYPNNILFPK